MENLESVIESVVFVAGEPVLISDLCVKFDVKQKQIEKAVEKLQEITENNFTTLSCLFLMEAKFVYAFAIIEDVASYIVACI